MEMMKALVGLLVVLVATMAMAQDVPFSDKDLESEDSMWSLYERWRSAYTVSLDLADKGKKFETFKKNARYINDFNKKENTTYELGLNKFADMTMEEFTSMYTGFKVDAATIAAAEAAAALAPEPEEELLDVVPASWDWRQHGAVTAVRNQRPCGCCWAFTTVGAVEGAHAIATGQLLTLSEQQVLDCSGAGDCIGGYPDRAIDFVAKQGITQAVNYPAYLGIQQTCRTNPNNPVVKVDGVGTVPYSSEAALKNRVSKQPVSVGVSASESYVLYKGGVYAGPCNTSLNHAVLAVGYGTTAEGVDYWIVKNSWGASWGEGGYMRMKRGVGKEGLCGIAMFGSYPFKRGVSVSTHTHSSSFQEEADTSTSTSRDDDATTVASI
ncbi:zingipain-2-like [Oryza brachyantha]|uniref:zingipain-2-like n=1 Tax=Oryza brachyantha TaxID=4533 RepID=UPI001ADD21EB|nr:zingipain-2-like [Oryza brachyantha]